MVEVPGPEPDWEPAAAYQGGKRNPALQDSMWDYAVGGFRVVAGLSPSLDSLAARLRLHTERSWEDALGEVDAAIFSIRKIHFALSQTEGHPVKVWVSQDQTDMDAALDVLFEALGKLDPHATLVDFLTVARGLRGCSPRAEASA